MLIALTLQLARGQSNFVGPFLKFLMEMCAIS